MTFDMACGVCQVAGIWYKALDVVCDVANGVWHVACGMGYDMWCVGFGMVCSV